ncbi:UV excision repair protein Rad23 [Terfezia boudieri ATCC MYA-4762]|uniref:UV excision repair protein RAD23 n=1 Tax=Terfezia boudieri ATCC MYA-4762 TaxID=1051890 RepID=A0A3N4LV68_9PEZI|nr:UV excision repair protein Rad23 [Terfezia boudieri ATCC MYA-4762]
MKLTFKDLKQQKFFVEAEPSETIATLKEKISTEKGWEVAQQKLIYSGKILQDQNTIGSYNIEEKGFIVCMISKPKAPPADKEAAGSSASTPKKVAPSTPAQQVAPLATPAAPSAPSRTQNVPETPSPAGTGAAAAAAAAAVPEPAAAPSFNDPSALAMGAQREAAIQNMLEMGYERENIDRAMRAAFYNPDRAVEYLLMGIPEHLQQEQRQPPARQAAMGQPAANPASPPAAVSPAAAAPEGENVNLFEAAANAARQRQQGGGAGAGAGLGNLEFLRNNPQFQQLRQVVQQQPQMLEPILQQVSQGNPGLAALINQNQEQFLQLLGENSDNDDDGPGGAMPPGTHQVVVTEEERQAIERLCRLGFERDLVIQAYFAFDKNEELAANFLFEQPDGDDE